MEQISGVALHGRQEERQKGIRTWYATVVHHAKVQRLSDAGALSP